MATRLRELRTRGGYSQAGIAEKAGVSQSTWSIWERETPEQFTALRQLAKRLKMSADYLLGITDDPPPPARRGQWTPEAIAVVELMNALPVSRREAALAILQGAIDLTTSEIEIQRMREAIKNEHKTFLRLIKSALPSSAYERIEKLVDAGQPLTDSEILRFLQAPGHEFTPNELELPEDDDLSDKDSEG